MVKAYFQPQGTGAADRAELTGDGSKSMYGFRHEPMHASIASVWKNGGYGDVYVVDGDNNLVYSVTKSDDFLLNLSDAALASSGLAESVKAAAAAGVGHPVISSFGSYKYAGGTPAVFVAQAVPSALTPDTAAGFVVIRLDVGFFDAVLGRREGLGETGQTYLVGWGWQAAQQPAPGDGADGARRHSRRRDDPGGSQGWRCRRNPPGGRRWHGTAGGGRAH